MNPVLALRISGKLKAGSVLDIGARDCRVPNRLAELGCLVDAIDPEPAPDNLHERVSFRQMQLEDLTTDKTYDIVVASLISHLVSYDTRAFLTRLRGLMADKGAIYVTLIGDRDDWADKPEARAQTLRAAMQIVTDLGLKPKYSVDAKFAGRLYSGDPKFWHLLHLVLEEG